MAELSLRDLAISSGMEAMRHLEAEFPGRMEALSAAEPDMLSMLVQRVACRASAMCLAEAHRMRETAVCACPECDHLASRAGRCHACFEAGCEDEILCQVQGGAG